MMSEDALWATLAKLLNELIKLHNTAMRKQKLRDFGPMMPLFRDVHWVGAFLGLTDLADVAAGSAVFVSQIQQTRLDWSEEHSGMLRTILDRIKAFITSRESQPSDKASSAPPPPRRPIKVNDLKAFFLLRQINLTSASSCHRLLLDETPSTDLLLRFPSFATKRHQPDRTLSLIRIDLEDQVKEIAELAAILEDSTKNSDLLLHGPLTDSSAADDDGRKTRPYYFLLDTDQQGAKWLATASLNGSTTNIPANFSERSEPKMLRTHSPHVVVRGTNTLPPNSVKPPPANDPISFDADSVMELEPLSKPKFQRKTRKKRKRRKIRNRDLHIRFTVGAKLQVIVSIIILVAMLSVSFVSFYLSRSEISNNIEDMNISLANLVAIQAESEFLQLFDSANLLLQIGIAAAGSETLVDDFFANSQSLVYVGIPESGAEFFNRDWFRSNHISDEIVVLQDIADTRKADIDRARLGETVVVNVSPLMPNLETPVLALMAPFLLGAEQEVLLILADIGGGLSDSVRMQEGLSTTVIVNSSGEVLAHPDYSRVFGGENIKDSLVFIKMYAQGATRGLIRFTEETGNGPATTIGSFTMIPVGNLGVVSTVLEEDAFRSVNRVQILNLTLLGSVLSLTILGVFFFAQSISTPLKELALATRQIKAKNYAISIKPRSTDEVGQLTRHFLSMIPELEKVERLQDRTSRLVNPQVAEMISDNSLPEHAETKDITVFFSDIRNFTAMSEQMGDPQLVLDNLSEYFRAVVPCIEKTQGTVDKFIGDAIMAVWGSMQDLPNNAKSAIEGALMIREILIDFNKSRGSLVRPIFQIGCGLNSGPATVGMMGGGSAKEEWAHIGDTINLASRVEALNKVMGTDILITETTSEKVKGLFDLVPMQKIKVKGKAKPLNIYAVLGYIDDDKRPKSLTELRAMLGIEGDFKKVTTVEEHEVKYEILTP